jgi:hypothetical protein
MRAPKIDRETLLEMERRKGLCRFCREKVVRVNGDWVHFGVVRSVYGGKCSKCGLRQPVYTSFLRADLCEECGGRVIVDHKAEKMMRGERR